MNGEGRLFTRRRSPFIWMAWYVDGKEYRESTGTTDRNKAKKHLKKRLREKAAHEETGRPFIGPEQKRVRVGELLDAFERDAKLRGLSALPKLRSHVRAVRKAFGDLRAVHTTPEAIDRYISECLAEGVARATVNRRLQVLRQSLRLGMERKLLAYTPKIRRLSEVGNERQGFFEHGDFEAVVAQLPDYLKDFARFAYLTGWRKGEIASLTWADLDREGRVLRLRPEASKNRDGRLVPLEGELWELVERRRGSRMVSQNGGAVLAAHIFHLEGQPVGDFRKVWANACVKAALGRWVCRNCNTAGRPCPVCSGAKRKTIYRYGGPIFHDLRRTAVRNLVRAGVPERVAMQISGHKTRHIFDRYNVVSETDLREAARKQQAYLAATKQRAVIPLRPAQESGH